MSWISTSGPVGRVQPACVFLLFSSIKQVWCLYVLFDSFLLELRWYFSHPLVPTPVYIFFCSLLGVVLSFWGSISFPFFIKLLHFINNTFFSDSFTTGHHSLLLFLCQSQLWKCTNRNNTNSVDRQHCHNWCKQVCFDFSIELFYNFSIFIFFRAL